MQATQGAPRASNNPSPPIDSLSLLERDNPLLTKALEASAKKKAWTEKFAKALDNRHKLPTIYRVTVEAQEDNPKAAHVSLQQAAQDLKDAGVKGQLRFSTGNKFGRFTLETFMDANEMAGSYSTKDRLYKLEAATPQPKTRVATASIINLPVGVNDMVMDWLNAIGEVKQVDLPDPESALTRPTGTVTFSKIHDASVFTPEGSYIELPSHQPNRPVTIKFANYVLKDTQFFMADDDTKNRLLALRTLEKVRRIHKIPIVPSPNNSNNQPNPTPNNPTPNNATPTNNTFKSPQIPQRSKTTNPPNSKPMKPSRRGTPPNSLQMSSSPQRLSKPRPQDPDVHTQRQTKKFRLRNPSTKR